MNTVRSMGGGILHGAPHRDQAGHRPDGIADTDTSRILECAHLADLLTLQALGERPQGHDTRYSCLFGAASNQCGDCRGIDDGIGVGRAAQGGDAGACRGTRFAGDGRLVFLAGLTQMCAQSPPVLDTRYSWRHRSHDLA